ncbi:long-chain-fatty-acid--CoA ligase [Variovorax ginsengisoli]|uniref:Long-chain-fatty-acid--CoA ligase n=1 Tax=Variovorax ginsengisoli TaxID=363844 RepID=A0ABT8SCE5_9BURK|nr:long-chain-fatty-acid--CoA ligase [Variovorax ginsengisoli]MDN8617422.1 long-chain-fatty-acid--CoA ligase [Variovorax ginsengisoli]MDO1536592.1 long-chain-fatty-acid--CoA ligase [Variovorax ginsengisoli]
MESNVTPDAFGANTLLIKQLLEAGLARNPSQEIVCGDAVRFDYAELSRRIGRLAAGLASLGARPGDTIAVMDWDTHRYLECFFAVPMAGMVLHTVNVRLSVEQLLYTINHAKDDFILVNTEFLPMLEAIWDRVEPGKQLVVLSDAASPRETRLPIAAEYEALLAKSHPVNAWPDLEESARATTFYTTGTTGLPKAVHFSHRQLVLHTLASRAALSGPGAGRFNHDDVYMPVTPMFHVHAWGLPYVATMMGVKQVYPGRYVPDRLLTLFAREKVTFSHCVPTILQMILDSAAVKGQRLDGWTVVIGGAALPQSLARAAMGWGVDVFAGYGMSETGPILTLAQPRSGRSDSPSDQEVAARCHAGWAIPFVQLRVVDDAMKDQPRDGNSPGELVARSPWLTQSYLGDAQASQALWRGGWLHTGDIAVMDPDGCVRIVDRLKDVIKTGGEWVSSLQLEDILLKHPQVQEAAVIGIPDPRWSERPAAIVVLKEGVVLDADTIRSHVKTFADAGAISKFAIPQEVMFADSLPKTSVGKLDKKLMRAQQAKLVGAA